MQALRLYITMMNPWRILDVFCQTRLRQKRLKICSVMLKKRRSLWHVPMTRMGIDMWWWMKPANCLALRI